MKSVLWFEDLSSEDAERVGEKGSDLGMIYSTDIPVPQGFATTSDAYKGFIHDSGLRDKIQNLISGLDTDDVSNLQRVGRQIRGHIEEADLPEDIRKDLVEEYRKLEDQTESERPVFTVYPSVVDNSDYSFEEDYQIKVSGEKEFVKATKKLYASLFNNKAISIREQKDISHFDTSLSVIIQETEDVAASGIMSTTDPDSGHENIINIKGSYGLTEYIANGKVDSDQFTIFKEKIGVIERRIGNKEVKLVEEDSDTVERSVPQNDREKFCITDNQVRELAKYGLSIEEHLSQPAKVEWVMDDQNHLHIIEIERENVEGDENIVEHYRLQEESDVLLQGESIGSKIASGKVNVVSSPKQIDQFEGGEILVTDTTDADWEPLIDKASAIITNKDGITSHAAVMARELGKPAVVGTENATSNLKDDQAVTVDCSTNEGKIWSGELEFKSETNHIDDIPETETDIQVNISDPEEALHAAQLPADGVGLVREEFILSSEIGEHPLHLIDEGMEDEFVEALRSGIGKVAAAFYPDEVTVRLSSFNSKEYTELEGGEEYESKEENPLLGFRGASRYNDPIFKKVFELECKALNRAIEELGLDNIRLAVPLCRTVDEGKQVKAQLKEHGLNNVKVDLIVETPANIVQAEEFAELFDGFSVDIENLAQLTLGVDRENKKIEDLYDETNPAVESSVIKLIAKAHAENTSVGFFSETDSTIKEYEDLLVENNIDSISVPHDLALETLLDVAEAEDGSAEVKREFSGVSPDDIGNAAAKVYDILNKQGKATAETVKDNADDVLDSDKVNQALGWLAKEGKVEVKLKKDGETKYHLN